MCRICFVVDNREIVRVDECMDAFVCHFVLVLALARESSHAGPDKDRAISLITWFVRCSKEMLCVADKQYFTSTWCMVEVITGMCKGV